jgi:hypothetical protein
VAFGLLFAGIGAFLVWKTAVRPVARWVAAESWTETPARVLESKVARSDGSLALRIEYEYRFEGKVFRSDRVHLNPVNLSSAQAQRLRDAWPKGSGTVAFVDPASPKRAVLERNAIPNPWLPLGGLPFLAIGLGVAGFSVAGKGAKGQRKGFTTAKRDGPRRWNMVFVGLPFLAFGLGFFWFGGARPILRAQEAAEWPTVPCAIEDSFVESHTDSEGDTTYSVEIRYTYEWEGRTFHGENYTFGDFSSSGRSGKEEIVERYPAGSEATCFVNPEDPYEAVITTDVGFLPYGIMGFGGLFGAIGAGLLLGGFRRRKTGLAAETVSPGESHASAPAPSRELKPRTHRAIRAIGVVLFAVVWNGLAVVPILIHFSGDGGEPFLLIFGLVFVAVGLGVIGFAGYTLLSLANPLPKARIEPGRIRPGETVRLSWNLEGSTGRLEDLGIFLEGTEVARYRRGTDTVTDRNVFHQQTVFESSDRGAFASGETDLELPAGTVPSFEAEHNEIVWQLVFGGSIRRWPDLNETMTLPVDPARPR